ncbi:MAG: MlaD family protein [Fibrobacter sp.]|jgi:phospholipid/cholesterol/gamma-HCH transport system substrate-binding protein|nr:MlaD family protein [Fibrobacter sp.]
MKRINWTELSSFLVGVFLAAAAIIFAVVLYAMLFQSGIIGVEEYKLHSRFEKVQGIHVGSKVQINGVNIGRVSNIEIAADGLVGVEFTIRKEYENWITDSSSVFAIRDQNLISERVINIDIRGRMGRVLKDGDFIPAGKAQDIETVLETVNQVLERVTILIDAADTLVELVMDTGTTLGALLGSRQLYDDLTLQLGRLDKITYSGELVMSSLNRSLPPLLGRADSITYSMKDLFTGLAPIPARMTGMFNSVDSTVGRMNALVDNLGSVTSSLGDFIEGSEQTLHNADDLIQGMSNMWIFRRSIPSKDTVPFAVENLW